MINYITIDEFDLLYMVVCRWITKNTIQSNIPLSLVRKKRNKFLKDHDIQFDAIMRLYRVPEELLSLIILESNIDRD